MGAASAPRSLNWARALLQAAVGAAPCPLPCSSRRWRLFVGIVWGQAPAVTAAVLGKHRRPEP